MARHYTIKEFFRQIPNVLLARLFQEQGLFKNLNFSAMQETKPDELFNAWLMLSEKDRKALDSKLQEIFELSCEKGFRAIIDEAEWQMQEEPGKFGNFIETLCAPCKGAYVQRVQIPPGNCYSGRKYFGVVQEATNGLKHSKKRPR